MVNDEKGGGLQGEKKERWSEGRERVSKRIVENMMINEQCFLLTTNILSSY
jgi:hypothetical protein